MDNKKIMKQLITGLHKINITLYTKETAYQIALYNIQTNQEGIFSIIENTQTENLKLTVK